MNTLAGLALGIPSLYVFLVGLYLVTLTVAAVMHRARPPRAGPATRRFAILVPAHDESLLIGRLLGALDELDYPKPLYDVHVVADNCHDETADVARSFGAVIHERVDEIKVGKGAALQWLIERPRVQVERYDAFVVVDADCRISSNFLRSMDARLEAGAEVVQACDSVLNLAQAPLASLRFAALAGYNYLRPLGRSALHLSVGLKGTGMCFAGDLLRRQGWESTGLAEDAEFHLRLVATGKRVDFAPEAWVLSDMPLTYDASSSQNSRWEAGRLSLVRSYLPHLLFEGMRRRSLVRLDAAAEQLIPPLSVPFAAAVLLVPTAIVAGAPVQAFLAGAGAAGQIIYLLAAMWLVRAPATVYLSLIHSPFYIAWKIAIYLRALTTHGSTGWVRTPRSRRGS
jgi:1,2-diacylglycerol 3-beta-glucosyltransferase